MDSITVHYPCKEKTQKRKDNLYKIGKNYFEKKSGKSVKVFLSKRVKIFTRQRSARIIISQY